MAKKTPLTSLSNIVLFLLVFFIIDTAYPIGNDKARRPEKIKFAAQAGQKKEKACSRFSEPLAKKGR